MYVVPEKWSDLMARFRFFDALPRPSAVLLICDLASMIPHDLKGRAAIGASRDWLLGQRREEELAEMFHAVFAGAWGDRGPEGVCRFAAACTLGVAAARRESALAAALAAGAASLYGHEYVGFDRQRQWATQVGEVARNETVRQLLRAAESDPSARPVFWDAMHDAGYAPIPVRSA